MEAVIARALPPVGSVHVRALRCGTTGLRVLRRGPIPKSLRPRRLSIRVSGSANPDAEILPELPSPDVGPKEVVLAQLAALQEKDNAALLKFASPVAKVKGVFEVERSHTSCSYNMLLGHTKSEVMGVFQTSKAEYEVLVRVWGMEVQDLTRVPATASAVFIWKLSKHFLDAVVATSNNIYDPSCWLTNRIEREYAEPDPRLSWLGLS
mmetsp:Transcript_18075/g.32190  ORF Transcript_18075/g.32190 Transcript_18075/m.32190 type:complete len:208 (-) Transcript_18075:219-842(-)|eukprot:CAMPEP_0177771878 /NCGR_PEP_ID=MMETSP0491_2-20121128/11878_1 /TAXON_ID=63592 /ORGANISM="Tetraselmis chuii, Strain PLY429" /LENGTH=207 /DNA_ID=CAMNT_0019289559 /DNA_START=153 /DNA_END=776 /DNA_ORIENTATION=+